MLNNKITTLKERLTCFIAQRRKDETDYSLVLLHEKVDALAEAAGYQFYKPRLKDHMGNDVLDVFRARKKAKR
jgi:hypothetical protein